MKLNNIFLLFTGLCLINGTSYAATLSSATPAFDVLEYKCAGTNEEDSESKIEFYIKSLNKEKAEELELSGELIDSAASVYLIFDTEVMGASELFFAKDSEIEISRDSGILAENSFKTSLKLDKNEDSQYVGTYVYKKYASYSLLLRPKSTQSFSVVCEKVEQASENPAAP